MVRKEGLQSERYAVTAVEADIGSVVASNTRRYIYRVKVQDDSGVANLVELKKQLALAAAVVVDQFRLVTPNETYVDPDELRDDALPLYIIEGGYTMRTVGTGTASLLLEYEDAV